MFSSPTWYLYLKNPDFNSYPYPYPFSAPDPDPDPNPNSYLNL